MRRVLGALAVAAFVIFIPACGTVRSTIDTLRALRAAGYTNTNVRYDNSNGFESVIVHASGGPTQDPVGKAAQIVWTSFKFKFDEVDVTVNGQRQVFTRSDLLERFGSRPPGSDKDLGKDVLRTVGIVGAVFLVFVAIVVVIIVVVVRNSRGKRPPPPVWYGGPPQGGAPPQWPPPPPPG